MKHFIFSGELLKELRMENHLTQCKLAKEVGVSKSCIWSYETGRSVPNYETYLKIRDFFAMPVACLAPIGNIYDEKFDIENLLHLKIYYHGEKLSSNEKKRILELVGYMKKS
jgi:DNA-binding XRE family transcriptional regulator